MNYIDQLLYGVGEEAPTTTNEQGGKQSAKRWRFDLFCAPSMFVLGRILDYGARKYGEQNWRQIPVESHLNAVQMHVFAYLAGDRRDDHLGHALARSMFALSVALTNGYDARQADEKKES